MSNADKTRTQKATNDEKFEFGKEERSSNNGSEAIRIEEGQTTDDTTADSKKDEQDIVSKTGLL